MTYYAFCLIPTILLFAAFLKMWVAALLWSQEFFRIGTAKILAIGVFTPSSHKPSGRLGRENGGIVNLVLTLPDIFLILTDLLSNWTGLYSCLFMVIAVLSELH